MKGIGKRALVALVSAMMAAVACAACIESPKAPENKPPVARIGAPAAGALFDTGISVQFDGSGSIDPEKKALAFSWDFGDNSTGSGSIPNHSYALPGRYLITLTVSDGKKRAQDTYELTILQANRAPVVKMKLGKPAVSNEEPLELNASGTADADNDGLYFNWSFGDGASGQGTVVTHLYALVGSYNITLNVSDGKTSASAVQTVTVFQANRPPVARVQANRSVAFLNEAIGFDASDSTDADNDPLTASWDFGDSSGGPGLKVSHSYSRMGNYTAYANVSDGKASSRAGATVTILPGASIFVDWNGTDYGYIIQTESDVEKANLNVLVVRSYPWMDTGYATLTEIAKNRYRAASLVEPRAGMGMTITVEYWGLRIGLRQFGVFGGTPMPFSDCEVTMDATMTGHTFNATVNSTMNTTGIINVKVHDWGQIADFAMELLGGHSEQTALNPDNSSSESLSNILGGWYNQTMYNGSVSHTSYEIGSEGLMTTVDALGKELQNLSSVSFSRKTDHNTTEVGVTMKGTQFGFAITYNIITLGIEDRANNYGKIFSCIKVLISSVADWFEPAPPGPPVHKMQFYNETQWNVRDDDHYENTTIYHNYTLEYQVFNVTTGLWELTGSSEDAGYVDTNGDGTFNPDPRPLGMDEAFGFDGPVPGALVVGDRIVGTNAHGLRVVMEVLDESVLITNGSSYTVVHLRSDYSGFGGNASGVTETWVVSKGNLTGLVLASREAKSWTSAGVTTEKTVDFKAVAVKEG